MGVDEVRERIEEIREEIKRLEREDKRNLAYAEVARKRGKERERFRRVMDAGRAVEAAGVLDDCDLQLLTDLLVKHREDIRRRND
jgi:hypothetical protein